MTYYTVIIIRRYFMILSLISIVVGMLPALYRFFGGSVFVNSFKLRHFYVNYFEFFFAKRALLGTITYPYFATFGDGETEGKLGLLLFESTVLAALIVMLSRLGRREGLRNSPIYVMVLAGFLFSPAGLMELTGDIGRFDHLNIVLILAASFAALKRRYPIVGALFCTTVLIHEASLFYGAGPIVTALLIDRARPRAFVICLFPAVAAMGAVLLYGNMSAAQLALLDARPGTGTNVWQRGALELPHQLRQLRYLLPLLFYALVPFAVLVSIVRHNGGSILRIVGPQMASLLLYPLGVDSYRWASLGFVSIATGLLIVADRWSWSVPRYPRPVAALLLLYLLPIGPLGIGTPLPLVELAFQRIADWYI